MRDGRTFDCGICGYSRALPSRIRFYETPDELPVLAWPCWCWSCDAVSLAEKIPGLAEIVDHCRAWKRRDRKFKYSLPYAPLGLKSYDDGRHDYAIDYYDSLFAWRKERKSPGRCLYCGSVRVGFARDQYGMFEHPHCGGMIRTVLHFSGGCGLAMAEVFSSEGRKLYEKLVRA